MESPLLSPSNNSFLRQREPSLDDGPCHRGSLFEPLCNNHVFSILETIKAGYQDLLFESPIERNGHKDAELAPTVNNHRVNDHDEITLEAQHETRQPKVSDLSTAKIPFSLMNHEVDSPVSLYFSDEWLVQNRPYFPPDFRQLLLRFAIEENSWCPDGGEVVRLHDRIRSNDFISPLQDFAQEWISFFIYTLYPYFLRILVKLGIRQYDPRARPIFNVYNEWMELLSVANYSFEPRLAGRLLRDRHVRLVTETLRNAMREIAICIRELKDFTELESVVNRCTNLIEFFTCSLFRSERLEILITSYLDDGVEVNCDVFDGVMEATRKFEIQLRDIHENWDDEDLDALHVFRSRMSKVERFPRGPGRRESLIRRNADYYEDFEGE